MKFNLGLYWGGKGTYKISGNHIYIDIIKEYDDDTYYGKHKIRVKEIGNKTYLIMPHEDDYKLYWAKK